MSTKVILVLIALSSATANVIRDKQQPDCVEMVPPSGCIGCTCVLTPALDHKGCPSYRIVCISSTDTRTLLAPPEEQENQVLAEDDLEWIKGKLVQIHSSVEELKRRYAQ